MFSMSFPAFFGSLAVPSGLGMAASGHSHKSLGLAVDLNKDIDFLSKHKNDRIFPGFKPLVTFDFSRTQITKDLMAQNIFRKQKSHRKPKQPKNAVEFIKFKYRELKCTSSMFTNIDFSNESKVTEKLANKGQAVSNIQTYTTTEQDKFTSNTKGCLSVWWDKKTYTNNKWTGKLNLILTLDDGKHGRIMFVDVFTENGKLYVDAIAYGLEKGNKNKWIIKRKEQKSKTEITKNDEEKLFIKPGDNLKKVARDDYWGFGSFDYDNICSKNSGCKDLKSDSKSEFTWYLNEESCSKSEQKSLMYNWSKNRSSWIQGLFPSNIVNLYDKIKGCF